MSKVILDTELKAKLQGLHQQLELCDASGQTMGRYMPEELYQELLYQIAESQRPHISADEIQRRRQMAGRKSLAEVLQALGPP